MSKTAGLNAPKPPFSPWQLTYNAVHSLRRRWYRQRSSKLPLPVVSVGNLHWGGTGKTPLTAAVARHLSESGRRVTVLSRGYGRRGTGVHLVSTGDGPLLGPRVAGDEPVALASELPGVAVVVGRDRYLAGRHAIERLPQPPECFVLDDGFSHVRLERDLDILVFPARDPFGGGRLAPSGRLREPLASAKQASAVILSGIDAEDPDSGLSELPNHGHQLARALVPYGYRGPGFESRISELAPVTERREPLPAGASVFLVTGIARPVRFAESAARLSNEVRGTLEFSDHHRYEKVDLTKIDNAARDAGAQWILTTTKDYVKLLGRLQTPLAHLPIRAEPEPAFWTWLDSELEKLS
jgi:tetraacyldisaccharide 4'-kinase